jgi:hypothetical protein
VKQAIFSLCWVAQNGGDAEPKGRVGAVRDADPIGSTTLGFKNLYRAMERPVVLECGREVAALDCGSLFPLFSGAGQWA